jgi:hypothetical protein
MNSPNFDDEEGRRTPPIRRDGVSVCAEMLRIGVLVLSVFWCFKFLLTANLIGGSDARWYGITMIDALTQTHAGHWPVFVSQSEWQWNGAVHPYRTAPYFLNLGILLDAITGHHLTPLSVEHLVLFASILEAVLLLYVFLTKLEPRARWLAWAAALAWALAPVAMGYVVNVEMYMTVMTFGWLPLVFYGNVRIIRQDDGWGWICLVSGLALTWMSHPAVAAWTTVMTAAMQGLRLIFRDFTWLAWLRALGGGLLFADLVAYYFYSIFELSPEKAGTSVLVQLGFISLMLAVIAAFRLLAGGTRHWWWPALAALGGLWLTNRLYLYLAASLLIWSACIRGWRRWRSGSAATTRLPEIAILGVLLSAAVAVQLPDRYALTELASGNSTMAMLHGIFPAILKPISVAAVALTDLQLGYALWAAAAFGCMMALWRGNLEARLFSLALVVAVPLLMPIPALSACFAYATPDWLFGISSVVWYRVLAPFSIMAVFTAFLAFAPVALAANWRRRKIAVGVSLIAAGIIWEGRELKRLQGHAQRSVNSSEQTQAFYRTDSSDRYFSYDNLPHPAYILSGTMDYHLESRLLSAADLGLLPEPLLDAPHGEEFTITTEVNPLAPYWLNLRPRFRLKPGEREIWKFEFFEKKYEGTLIARGPMGFSRYVFLPNGGDGEKSFGVGKDRPKTLALWNSLGVPQDFDLTFLMPAAQPGFGDFAKVKVRSYRPEDLQIQTLGLMPYRARVKTTVASFLETPRVYIPGYRAKLDGRDVRVEVSPEHLAMIRLTPGIHEVELSFRPSQPLLWAGVVSALGWLGLAGCTGRRLIRRR